MSQMISKTYVRGSFLYSTHDGAAYEQQNQLHGEKQQVLISDKANLNGLKKQMQQKKDLVLKKKQMNKTQKPVLIPIRDTPVEPVPQPVLQNNKCERATQQQFEYFQTYISQKQKQRQFQLQEQQKVDQFCKNQQQFRKHEEDQVQNKRVSIVLQKGEEDKKVKKKNIKILIKRKYIDMESRQEKLLNIKSAEDREDEQKKQDLNEGQERQSKVRVVE